MALKIHLAREKPQYLNAEQVAKKLKVSGQRIRQLLAAGRVCDARKVCRDWQVRLPIRIKPGKKPGRPRGS